MPADGFRHLRGLQRDLDAALRGQFSGVRAPASLRARLRRTIPQRVSLLPSLLDAVAWSAVALAVTLLLRAYLVPYLA
jgi:hypothetical protein